MNPNEQVMGNSQGGQTTPPNPFATPPAPVSQFGTRDIILSPTPKKSKKTLVLLIIAIALILAAAAALFVLSALKKSADFPATAFNRYANYLLYGEDSSAPLEGEYDQTINYRAYTEFHYSGSDQKDSFFRAVDRNFDAFTQSIDNSALDFDDEMTNRLAAYEDYLNIVINSATSDRLTEDEVTQYFIENGQQKTKTYIEQYFADFSNAQSYYAQQYGLKNTQFFNQHLNMLNAAQQSGCIKNQTIDATCINPETYQTYSSDMQSLADDIVKITNISLNYVIYDCWSINAMIGEYL